MFQSYINKHTYNPAASVAAGSSTIALAANVMTVLTAGSAPAYSAVDATYAISPSGLTTVAGRQGLCALRFVDRVGTVRADNVLASVATAAFNFVTSGNAPQVMAFTVDVPIGTTPATISLNNPSLRWLPFGYDAAGIAGGFANGELSVPVFQDIPADSDRYFGVALLFNYQTAGANSVTGYLSLRHAIDERALFQPYK